MPVSVKKQDGKYCVVEPGGAVVKCHSSKEKAMKHMQAININTKAAGPYSDESKKPAKKDKGKKAEGQESLEPQMMPKVVIVSDGDFASTRLFVRGQEVQVNDVWLTAKKGDPNSEYEWEQKDEFSLSLSTNRVVDGMEQTITLRMREKAALELAEGIGNFTPESIHPALARLLSKEN